MIRNEVLIIGGGLAGLTAAIHISKIGIKVTVIEKNDFPKHKVCGEYISNEVLPYLKWLDLDISKLHPSKITKLQLAMGNGKTIGCNLPLGGFGISRFTLDEFLYNKALANNCKIIKENVESIIFKNDEFIVTTSKNTILKSTLVIGAYGKRANLDQTFKRDFILKKSPWLAVKAHYKGDFPNDLVGLYNFNGGYCGVSKIEDNSINICYLTDFKTFKNYKNTNDYEKQVMCQNPILKVIFENVTPIFKRPLTISQISFDKKKAVENHVLMIGDTAGLIHPLCGNGMAMAIHSAKIVSELIGEFHYDKIKSRAELEKKYTKEWNFNFKNRLKIGRFLSIILQKKRLSYLLLAVFIQFPSFLPNLIKRTHGKPIIIKL